MSKQKTQLKGKRLTAMVASIAMVAATALSLGAATYAWFTRGTGATASGFNFTASAAEGIQISTDALDWKSHIVGSDFTPLLEEGQAQAGNRIQAIGMDPTSTNGVPAAGALTFYSAEEEDGQYTIVENNNDFLKFDIYFNNQSTSPLTLRLDSTSSVTDGTPNAKTSLATRVAFINQGVENIGNTQGIIALNGADGKSNTYIWEPNSTERSAAASASGAVSGAKYEYEALVGNNGGSPITQDFYGYIGANAAYTKTVDYTNDLAMGDTDVILTLTATKVTKVTVYVWLEGQDIDNDNSTAAGNVNINLNFETGTTPVVPVTADSLSANEVSLETATVEAGTTYSAFVIKELQIDEKGYKYRGFVAGGEDIVAAVEEGGQPSLTTIPLTSAVPTGTYNVIVVGAVDGKISSRTQATLGLD